MTNEKCYLMGKFARVALETRHCDYNGRLCMSSATGANERSLGIDRAANPISDMLHSDVIFVIGANVGECFPIVTSWLWQARDRGAKLIVADPRQTPIARTADIFLPLRSGTDSALLNAMLNVVIREGLVDEEFIRSRTNGWDETKALVEQYPPERVAKVCGLRPETIIEAARLYGRAKAAMIYTARGLEHQSKGVDNGVAAVNLALATGNFGRPGAGYMTLTGQGNGQGGREMGQKASQLPGEREIENPEDRAYICLGLGHRRERPAARGLSGDADDPRHAARGDSRLLHDLLESDGLAARPAYDRARAARPRFLRGLRLLPLGNLRAGGCGAAGQRLGRG